MTKTEVTELDQTEDDVVRAKRSEPIYLNQGIYSYPANPYYFAVQPAASGSALIPQASKSSQEQQGLLYQPQYYYDFGLPVAAAKAGKQFPALPIQPTYFNQPSYNIPYVAPGQAVRSDSEVPITDKPATDYDETATNFPYVPPGAIVAEEPLPENAFPIFPYDPEQDKPAAVQF